MTVQEIFALRKQGRIEEAYEAIRPMYAVHKGRYTTLCMFWTACDVLAKRVREARYDEASAIFKALMRMLSMVPDGDGRSRTTMLYKALMMSREVPSFSLLDFIGQHATGLLTDAHWVTSVGSPAFANDRSTVWQPVPVALQLLSQAYYELLRTPTVDNALLLMPLLQQAVQRTPQEVSVRCCMALVYRILGQHDKADAVCRSLILPATPVQAEQIAHLIMMAMTDECCLSFCGEGKGLDDFRQLMVQLVGRADSQYSWRNTLVALGPAVTAGGEPQVVGIATAYDGARLHELRRAFVDGARQQLGRDHSAMADETQAGELYLDSLAVLPSFRRQGIARLLLEATARRARELHIPQVGLLVDKGNPTGERLYTSVGFRYAGDSRWGGHDMKHLVLTVDEQ